MQTVSGVNKNMWRRKEGGLFAPVRRNFPIYGLVFYAPLWHPELSGSPFYTKDLIRHTCTVTEATHGITGRTFDGDDDKIVIATNAALSFTTGDLSVMAWVYRDAGSDADNDIIGGSTLDAPNLEVAGAGSVHFAKPSTAQVTADTAVADVTWTNLGVSFDNSEATGNVIFYNSGAADGVKDFDQDFADYINCIGAGNNAAAWFWDGLIGEVWIYNRILSAGEFLHAYDTTKWRYQ